MLRIQSAIIVCIVIFSLATITAGQTEAKTHRFDEFGQMSQAGVKKKMDGFLMELARDRSEQGYIINYGSPKAIAARRKQLTRSITFLSLDPSQMTFIDGGFEKQIRTVMWIVPAGATPPTP